MSIPWVEGDAIEAQISEGGSERFLCIARGDGERI